MSDNNNNDYNKQILDENDKAFLALAGSGENDIDSESVVLEEKKQKEPNFFAADKEFSNIDCEKTISKILKDNQTAVEHVKKRRFYFFMVTILVGVLSLIMFFAIVDSVRWVSYILFALFFIGLIWYLSFSGGSKRKILSRFEKNLRHLMKIEDSYAFSQDGLLHPSINQEYKFKIDEIIKAHYFKTINKISFRNTVKATFRGRELRCTDLFVQVPFDYTEKNETQISNKFIKSAVKFGLYGKYFTYPVALANKAGIIIYTANDNIEKPNYLNDYKKIHIEGLPKLYEVYTTDTKVCRSFFKQEHLIESLQSLRTDKVLESYFLSIDKYGLFIGMNYSQSLMEFKAEHSLSQKPFKHFKNDLKNILSLLKTIV